jgi:hypothetical protein
MYSSSFCGPANLGGEGSSLLVRGRHTKLLRNDRASDADMLTIHELESSWGLTADLTVLRLTLLLFPLVDCRWRFPGLRLLAGRKQILLWSRIWSWLLGHWEGASYVSRCCLVANSCISRHGLWIFWYHNYSAITHAGVVGKSCHGMGSIVMEWLHLFGGFWNLAFIAFWFGLMFSFGFGLGYLGLGSGVWA